MILLSILCAVLLVIEWLRLKGKISLPEILLRPHEDKQVAGYIYFMMAALISILVFDKTIAMAAILMLAIGDTASGLAGAVIKGGNVRHKDTEKMVFKPLSIMLVMFFVCLAIGITLLNLPKAPDMIPVSFLVYVAGGLGATLGDSVPISIFGRHVDDNLIIPLLSGTLMTLTGYI